MSARYAVYYAPRPATPLWDKACAWLGRDAYTGQALVRPDFPVLADLDLDALTADPRGYGFHATLKAPFELASDRREIELIAAVRRLAGATAAFQAAIAPEALGRFLAFRLVGPSRSMGELHGACVRELDAYRAPLSAFDLARRRKASLSPEQDARLTAWGYPYVFEDFRFHMTLTGQIADEAVRARVLTALKAHFADETGPHLFDGIALFKQADRQSPFQIVERSSLETLANA